MMGNIRRDEIPKTGFYAYVHCRPDGTPFYVGKGSCGPRNKRAYEFDVSRNSAYRNCVAKHGKEHIHVRVYGRDSEIEAFDLERSLIAQYRKSGLTIHNLADGGIGGTSGVVQLQATNAKRSATLSGRHLDAQHAAKIGDSLRGRSHSENSKINMARGQRNRFAVMPIGERQALVSKATTASQAPEAMLKRSEGIKRSWVIRKLNAKSSVEKEV